MQGIEAVLRPKNELLEAVDERAECGQRQVGKGERGVAKEQVAVGGLEAGLDEGEGEDEFFRVLSGSSKPLGVRVELAEGADGLGDLLWGESFQGCLWEASFWFHGSEYTRSPPIFRTPSLTP